MWLQYPRGSRWVTLILSWLARALCQRRQWSGQQSLGPLSCPWPGLEGRLKGSLRLISPCHKVCGSNQLTNIPLASSLDMAWVACAIRTTLDPVTLLTTFEVGTQWSLSLRRQGSLDSCRGCSDGLGQCLIFLFTGCFISPLVHIKGQH